MNSARSPVKLIFGQMRGICRRQGTNWPSLTSLLSSSVVLHFSLSLYKHLASLLRMTQTNGLKCLNVQTLTKAHSKVPLCHDAASVHIDSLQCEYKASAWPLMSHDSWLRPARSLTNTTDADLKKSVTGQGWEKEVSSSIIHTKRHTGLSLHY